MEVRVDVLREGDTSDREILALTRTLRSAIEQMREVDTVTSVKAFTPERAMGVADTVGAFLMGLPVDAITSVLGLLKAIVSRPGQPPVKIKVTAASVDISFNPRSITPKEIAILVERLRPKPRGA